MSEVAFERLIEVLSAYLADQSAPIAPSDVINSVRGEDQSFSANDVRQAIWQLESEGRITFDDAWQIRNNAVAA